MLLNKTNGTIKENRQIWSIQLFVGNTIYFLSICFQFPVNRRIFAPFRFRAHGKSCVVQEPSNWIHTIQKYIYSDRKYKQSIRFAPDDGLRRNQDLLLWSELRMCKRIEQVTETNYAFERDRERMKELTNAAFHHKHNTFFMRFRWYTRWQGASNVQLLFKSEQVFGFAEWQLFWWIWWNTWLYFTI